MFVKAQDRDRKFSDVLVWAEGSGLQGCSAGSFDSNPDLYHQPDNCPHLVTRNSKVPEHLFQVTWTAPPCGCVTIRWNFWSEVVKTYSARVLHLQYRILRRLDGCRHFWTMLISFERRATYKDKKNIQILKLIILWFYSPNYTLQQKNHYILKADLMVNLSTIKPPNWTRKKLNMV